MGLTSAKLDLSLRWSLISYKSILKLSMTYLVSGIIFLLKKIWKTGKIGGGHLLFPKINGERVWIYVVKIQLVRSKQQPNDLKGEIEGNPLINCKVTYSTKKHVEFLVLTNTNSFFM